MRPVAPVVGVGGVVVRDGRALLVRRGKPPLYGRWVVPGGTVELGETLEEALVRELREETGLDVEPVEVLAVFDRIERDAAGVAYHYVIVDYLCRWLSGEAAAASDALDVAWVGPGEHAGVRRAAEGRSRWSRTRSGGWPRAGPQGPAPCAPGAGRLCSVPSRRSRGRGHDASQRSRRRRGRRSHARRSGRARARRGQAPSEGRSPSSRRSAPRPARATSSGRSRPSPCRRRAACCGPTPPSTRATTSARRRPSASGRARPTRVPRGVRRPAGAGA